MRQCLLYVCFSVFFYHYWICNDFFFFTDNWNATAVCRKRLSILVWQPPTAGLLGLVNCDPGGLLQNEEMTTLWIFYPGATAVKIWITSLRWSQVSSFHFPQLIFVTQPIQQRDLTVSPKEEELDMTSSPSLPSILSKVCLIVFAFLLPHHWREIRANLTFTKLRRKQNDFHREEHL